ncbi:MAG TPA: hypothetical protein VM010_01170 [Chitinophagaceae bacterium]|nr:hypothetical protein [Chitinophagaceae bacterium]
MQHIECFGLFNDVWLSVKLFQTPMLLRPLSLYEIAKSNVVQAKKKRRIKCAAA